MSIASTLDTLVTIEEGLSITTPIEMSIKKAWDSEPDANQPVPESDLPAWLNEWEVSPGGTWLAGSGREVQYTVHAILLVGGITTELNRRMRIATEFWGAFVTALEADTNLSNTDLHMEIQRAKQGLIRYAARSYVGLEVWLDITEIGANA